MGRGQRGPRSGRTRRRRRQPLRECAPRGQGARAAGRAAPRADAEGRGLQRPPRREVRTAPRAQDCGWLQRPPRREARTAPRAAGRSAPCGGKPAARAGGLVASSRSPETEFCEPPPEVRNAVFSVSTYKNGTILSCECRRGFRRVSGRPFMRCVGDASGSAWDKECQCVRASPGSTGRVTRSPDGYTGRRHTAGHGQAQPPGLADLSGHCGEPPPWEHEGPQRTYHFVVGQELHYRCAPGFGAGLREPARSVCEKSSGETRWTPPQLACEGDGGRGPLPGDKQPPPDAPGSRTACPPPSAGAPPETAEPEPAGTAEPSAHTGAAVTAEWPSPVRHLTAAAYCALPLLLAGVLLLGGLAWQRRWRKMRGTI
ncbi:interleukin-2 receptor subunit alpha [Sorex araneus]|uniref:interleukin-2 receptor subunit alpha n=1 Tax=Sorex araneus TaxID=42254 RepID=UPI002433B41B|nr:interleukin-2 receptor subunit alpha [Sorex araneus]